MPKTVIINMGSKKVIKKNSIKKRMAGKKKGKQGKSRGNSSSSLFSGKVLGVQVPGARGVLKNKTLQKVLVGAGAVSVGLAVVQLINNPTLNKFAARKEVRIGAAAIAGDIPGAAFQFFKEDGITKIRGMTSGTQTASNQQIGQVGGLA